MRTLFPPFSLGKLFYSQEHFILGNKKFSKLVTNIGLCIFMILFPGIYKYNLKQTHPNLFSVLITMKMPLSIIVMSIGLGWFRLPKKKSFCFNKYVKYIIDYPNNIYFAITNKFFIWVKYY